MMNWLKKLKAIVSGYEADLRTAHARIAALENLVKDHTNIAIDVGFSGANHVIVVGRYKNADYVQTYNIHTDDFSAFVDQLRNMERYGKVRRVDAPPTFRAAFSRIDF